MDFHDVAIYSGKQYIYVYDWVISMQLNKARIYKYPIHMPIQKPN